MMIDEKTPVRWVIYSNEHGAFWRPGRLGYTQSLAEAGRYSTWATGRILSQSSIGEQMPGGVPKEQAMAPPEVFTEWTDLLRTLDEEGKHDSYIQILSNMPRDERSPT